VNAIQNSQPSPAEVFSMLPAAVALPAAKLWAMNAEIYPDATPLAWMLAGFINDHDLPEVDAAKIMADLTHPANMMKFRFAADLKTEIASRVNDKLRERREAKKLADMRAEAAGVKPTQVQQAIRGIGKAA
jgi:hypothetical protein